MSEKIEPALTAEEWAHVAPLPAVGVELVWPDAVGRAERVVGAHAAAALALYGQPFGFTREDVALLRGERFGGFNEDRVELWEAMDNLAARIAALLPPE